MSTINGDCTSSAASILQRATPNRQPQPVPADTIDTAPTPEAEAARSAHGRRRHGPDGALFQKIQDAVITALQQAKESGTSDPNKVIEDAIAQVFKDNGIPQRNPTASPVKGTGRPGKNANRDDDAHSARQPARQAFFDALAQFGVDPKQFRKDFVAAIKDAQGGSIAPGTAFQSFPAGIAVSTTA